MVPVAASKGAITVVKYRILTGGGLNGLGHRSHRMGKGICCISIVPFMPIPAIQTQVYMYYSVSSIKLIMKGMLNRQLQ